jgi:hypothetical protein
MLATTGAVPVGAQSRASSPRPNRRVQRPCHSSGHMLAAATAAAAAAAATVIAAAASTAASTSQSLPLLPLLRLLASTASAAALGRADHVGGGTSFGLSSCVRPVPFRLVSPRLALLMVSPSVREWCPFFVVKRSCDFRFARPPGRPPRTSHSVISHFALRTWRFRARMYLFGTVWQHDGVHAPRRGAEAGRGAQPHSGVAGRQGALRVHVCTCAFTCTCMCVYTCCVVLALVVVLLPTSEFG